LPRLLRNCDGVTGFERVFRRSLKESNIELAQSLETVRFKRGLSVRRMQGFSDIERGTLSTLGAGRRGGDDIC
jgi:hypothetical protein